MLRQSDGLRERMGISLGHRHPQGRVQSTNKSLAHILLIKIREALQEVLEPRCKRMHMLVLSLVDGPELNPSGPLVHWGLEPLLHLFDEVLQRPRSFTRMLGEVHLPPSPGVSLQKGGSVRHALLVVGLQEMAVIPQT